MSLFDFIKKKKKEKKKKQNKNKRKKQRNNSKNRPCRRVTIIRTSIKRRGKNSQNNNKNKHKKIKSIKRRGTIARMAIRTRGATRTMTRGGTRTRTRTTVTRREQEEQHQTKFAQRYSVISCNWRIANHSDEHKKPTAIHWPSSQPVPGSSYRAVELQDCLMQLIVCTSTTRPETLQSVRQQ